MLEPHKNFGVVEEQIRQGNWLFRWRSYVPIIILVPFGIALATMRWPWGSYLVHEFWEFACLGLSFAGLVVRVLVIGYVPTGTSGRVTQQQVAETLNTTGLYSLVRHPLYLGNFLIWFGIALVPMNLWFAGFFVLAFWLYYERIAAAEENYLQSKFGEDFTVWAKKTPAFVPALHRWKTPALRFSWRNVFKREYTALFGIIAGHWAVEVAEHLIIEARLPDEIFWHMFAAAGVVAYVVLRLIRHRTRLLHVDGR